MNDIKFISLTMRNFLSYGNNETVVELDFTKPTLVVGKNFDSVKDGQITSNGAGKTTILNAIAVVAYDKPISKLKVSELINNTNEKNMYLSLTFVKNHNIYYKIERFRKNKAMGGDGVRVYECVGTPGVVPSFEPEHEKAPDSMGNINEFIANVIGIPFEVFSRIVIFSARHEPFLSLPASSTSGPNQRDVIEELFGITELTVKADLLKEQIKENKRTFENMEEINATLKRERDNHVALSASVAEQLQEWNEEQTAKIKELSSNIEELKAIDLAEQVELWGVVKGYDTKIQSYTYDVKSYQTESTRLEQQKASAESWGDKHARSLKQIQEKIAALPQIDEAKEESVLLVIDGHKLTLQEKSTELGKLQRTLDSLKESVKKLDQEMEHLTDSKCPYCKQNFKDAKIRMDTIELDLADYRSDIKIKQKTIDSISVEIETTQGLIAKLGKQLTWTDINKLKAHGRDVKSLEKEYATLVATTTPYDLDAIKEEIVETDEAIDILQNNIRKVTVKRDKTKELLLFDTEKQAIEAAGRLSQLETQLESLKVANNPHTKTLARVNTTKFEELKTDELDALADTLDHQNFLLKLLTKKDSFVRKILLQKNLPFLNSRLKIYLEFMGLPHRVSFVEDLSVKITQFGKETPFGGMSGGQCARINLALAFAFRDVLQARHGRINFCILDECLDTGLDSVGVQFAAEMIKNIAVSEKLSMFVITHKDEVTSMFDRRLEVELRHGFSTIV